MVGLAAAAHLCLRWSRQHRPRVSRPRRPRERCAQAVRRAGAARNSVSLRTRRRCAHPTPLRRFPAPRGARSPAHWHSLARPRGGRHRRLRHLDDHITSDPRNGRSCFLKTHENNGTQINLRRDRRLVRPRRRHRDACSNSLRRIGHPGRGSDGPAHRLRSREHARLRLPRDQLCIRHARQREAHGCAADHLRAHLGLYPGHRGDGSRRGPDLHQRRRHGRVFRGPIHHPRLPDRQPASQRHQFFHLQRHRHLRGRPRRGGERPLQRALRHRRPRRRGQHRHQAAAGEARHRDRDLRGQRGFAPRRVRSHRPAHPRGHATLPHDRRRPKPAIHPPIRRARELASRPVAALEHPRQTLSHHA